MLKTSYVVYNASKISQWWVCWLFHGLWPEMYP